MRRAVCLLSLALVTAVAHAQVLWPFAAAYPAQTTGINAPLSVQLFGASYPLNQSVAGAKVDGTTTALLPQFVGSGTSIVTAKFDPSMPWNVVDSRVTPFVPVTLTTYAALADTVLVPIPANLAVETGSDKHALIFDIASGGLFELFQYGLDAKGNALPAGSPPTAAMVRFFPTNTATPYNPWDTGSADAAGLSILEGTTGYDEAAACKINHALRVTFQNTSSKMFYLPAEHSAGTVGGYTGGVPIMGQRYVLSAIYVPPAGLSPINQCIVKALQTYGAVNADNGISVMFTLTLDPRWNTGDLLTLAQALPFSAFNVVSGTVYAQQPGLQSFPTVAEPTGAAPAISTFTVTPADASGNTQLTWTTTGANYVYLQNGLPLPSTSGSATVPAASIGKTLVAVNQFGITTAPQTVTNTPSTPSVPSTPTPGLTGTITFYDGGTALGAVPVSGGTATFSFAPAAGTHTITAVYSGDATDAASTSPSTSLVVTVPIANTGTTVSVNPNPAIAGQTTAVTATVVKQP